MTNEFIVDFIIVLLIFLRVLAAFLSAPVFGHQSIPTLVKIFLAFIIAYILFFVQKSSPVKVETSLWWLTSNAVKEVLTGLIIGYSLNLIFYGITFAGDFIGFDMGLSISEVFNPLDNSQVNVIGQALTIAALMIFILINGHHYLIRGLAYSFKIIPLGKFVMNESVYRLLIKYSSAVFVIAVKIASPIIISFFCLKEEKLNQRYQISLL